MKQNSQKVDTNIENGRGEIFLNRPKILNAFDDEMKDVLIIALNKLIEREDVYSIILSGRGRGFCSGADVSTMETSGGVIEEEQRLRKVQRIVQLLREAPKPTIAAINGPAVGAGCDFALACDLRVMAEDAILREQFVNIGLVPGDGGAWLLPRLIGESKAKEYILTGKDIDAETAEELGLLVEISESGQTLHDARHLAQELQKKPTMALAETKKLINWEMSYDDYCYEAIKRQWKVKQDPEHTEAVNAFLEKREPDFDRFRS